MARATLRTAFSPAVYEGMDFAVVLYDRNLRLLAQAPTVPIFMGTMSFCIEAAVEAVGGVESLEPGDVLVYNKPYGTGSHAQDCAIVMPVFTQNGALVGYAANKAHWMDIGAKSVYCSDTTDVFQEGVVIPGVKIFSAHKRDESLLRMILANSRSPAWVEGDMNAQIASCRVGGRELLRVLDRFGLETFESSVDRMIEHGESMVRTFLERIPDGAYGATCHMDNNGIDNREVEFDIEVRVSGSEVIVDLSGVPDAQAGPINCPLPSTVSGMRVALAMLAGGGGRGGSHEIPNEGHFRPLTVITRPGSMFHAVEPQPCYMYGWPVMSAMEGMYEALSKAAPDLVPAGSAGDICGVLYYGYRANGELFAAASPLPVGQGAHARGDGQTLFIPALANSSLTGVELQEAKGPVRFERWEFTVDSGGPGEFRGGMGWQLHYRVLENLTLISVIERTKVPGSGQAGGLPGLPNRLLIDFPDGRTEEILKVTDKPIPAGARIRLYCGGGGGYGPPRQRARDAVNQDLRNGLITREHAIKHYSHAM
jgi:N-methylhydantoinase B